MFKPKPKKASSKVAVPAPGPLPGSQTQPAVTPEEQDRQWREYQRKRATRIALWILGPLVALAVLGYGLSLYLKQQAERDAALFNDILSRVEITGDISRTSGARERYLLDGVGGLCVLKARVAGNPNYLLLLPDQSRIEGTRVAAATFKITSAPSDAAEQDHIKRWLSKCDPTLPADYAIVNRVIALNAQGQPLDIFGRPVNAEGESAQSENRTGAPEEQRPAPMTPYTPMPEPVTPAPSTPQPTQTESPSTPSTPAPTQP